MAEAALWANGFGDGAIEELRLDNGRLVLIDVQGRRASPHGDVAVWRKGPGHLEVPSEALFERVEHSIAELSALGLDGGFEARLYRVVDTDSGEDVAVRVAVGRSRVLLVVDDGRARHQDVPSA